MGTLPDPVIIQYDNILVVRDDLLPGGTKRRAIPVLFDTEHDEYVYAGPVYGHAQIALAYAAHDAGKQATIFCAKRSVRHQCTIEAEQVGAQIFEVEYGRLSVVQARARSYCCDVPTAKLLPFGLDDPIFIAALAQVARALLITPSEVWCACGSGVLIRALQQAWPDANCYGVRVGALPLTGPICGLFRATEKFEQAARFPPPFPSVENYDSKCWRFIKQHAKSGALFWNVAA